MSKLLKLKETLTLSETAKHLSIMLGEDVTEADILRLALDGHLKLSVNLVNHSSGILGKIVSFAETEWFLSPPLGKIDTSSSELVSNLSSLNGLPVNLTESISKLPVEDWSKYYCFLRSIQVEDDKFINLEERAGPIEGLWDLPMFGAERLDIEDKYQMLTGGPRVTLHNIDGVFLVQGDTVCLVHDNRDFPSSTIPDDFLLVVKTDELRAFEVNLSNNVSKPLNTTERNTLLTLIAALCKFDGVDPNARDATSQIVQMTEDLGAPISDDTIRKVLHQIPNALEARRKQ